MHCCRHMGATESMKAYYLVGRDRSSVHTARSCVARIQTTSQTRSVPGIADVVSPIGLWMDSYCELECLRRTHRQSNHWVGPWRRGRSWPIGRGWKRTVCPVTAAWRQGRGFVLREQSCWDGGWCGMVLEEEGRAGLVRGLGCWAKESGIHRGATQVLSRGTE